MGEPPPPLRRAARSARSTMTEAFRLTVEDNPDRVAVRTKDDEVRLTWAELGARVDALAGGLARLGVAPRRHGRADALQPARSSSSPTWRSMTLGATPFSIYQQFTPDQIAYVVGDAGAKVAIVEAAFLETFGAARARAARRSRRSSSSRAARGRGHDGLGATSRAPTRTSTPSRTGGRSSPTTSLTLIYTSGTTGPPKGVQLTHRNVMAARGRPTGSSTSPTARA